MEKENENEKLNKENEKKDKNKSARRARRKEKKANGVELAKFGEAGTVTSNNVMILEPNILGSVINILDEDDEAEAEVALEGGCSCIHVSVNLEHIVDKAFILPKGVLQQLIAANLTSLGYATDQTTIDNIYNALIVVTRRSTVAYADLLKMWQVQCGRQVHDVAGNEYGAVLFKPCGVQDYADRRQAKYNNSSVFDSAVSNAQWEQNFLSELQYMFLTPEMRAFLHTVFVPIRELTKGYTGTTAYMNIWPDHNFANYDWVAPGTDTAVSDTENTTNISSDFRAQMSEIHAILAANPTVTKVLASLGATTGSEFDFTRDTKQQTLYMMHDDGFADLIIAYGEPNFRNLADEPTEADILAQFIYLDDETPESVSSNVSTSMVSVINALKQDMMIFAYNYAVKEVYESYSETSAYDYSYKIFSEPYLCNTIAVVDIPNAPVADQYQKYYKALKRCQDVNFRAAQQRSRTDISCTYVHEITLNWDNLNPDGDTYYLKSGYGTFITDIASLILAQNNSATALLFGADYKSSFAKKINAIPNNNIKFR